KLFNNIPANVRSLFQAQFAEDLNFYGFYSGRFCVLSPRTSVAQSIFVGVLCGLIPFIQSHRINRNQHEQVKINI
ncbi:hypothetical protein N307_05633, partial [Dryobates pubescens]